MRFARRLGIAVVRSRGLGRRPAGLTVARGPVDPTAVPAHRAARPTGTATNPPPGLSPDRRKLHPSKSTRVLSIVGSDDRANFVSLFFHNTLLSLYFCCKGKKEPSADLPIF